MKNKTIKHLGRNLSKSLDRNSSTILLCIGAGLLVTSLGLMKKSTEEAVEVKKNLENEKEEPLTKKEELKATAKLYIPPLVTGAASVGCFVASHKIDIKNNAALMSAYAALENRARIYKEKTLEHTDPETSAKIEKETMDEIASSIDTSTAIYTQKDNRNCELFLEPASGLMFYCDPRVLDKALLDLAMNFANCETSLDDFLYNVGIPANRRGYASTMIGWRNDEHICIREPRWDDSHLYKIIDWETPPHYEFKSYTSTRYWG